MRTSWVLLTALLGAACGNSDSAKRAPTTGSGSAAPVAPVEAPMTGPHSGAIERIGVTDDGKAAYSIDTFGQARLWLALDGTKEPIVARGGRALQVAFGRTDTGFVAALLDEAGGIDLVRFDADGRTRGHAGIAPEPAFDQVLATNGGILARRRDQKLVFYDAGGHERGQISPEPGERIAGLAVRRDRAIAALVDASTGTTMLRWIVFGDRVAWGTRLSLKVGIETPIGLSPSGTKLAAIDPATMQFEIVDLRTGEVLYAKGADLIPRAKGGSVGFLDENSALYTDDQATTWWQIETKDPWATSQRGTPSDSDVAIGDGVMLDSSSTSLTITTPTSVRYLGYRDVGPSVLWATPSGIAMQRDTKTVWLDRDLEPRDTHVGGTATVLAVLGDHLLAIADSRRVYVQDTQTKEEKTIGTYDEAPAALFEPSSDVLVITTTKHVERFRVESAPLRVTTLAPLTPSSFGWLAPIDPRSANGIVGVTTTMLLGENGGHPSLDWFLEGTGADPVARRASGVRLPDEGVPIGADRAGVVYFLDRVHLRLSMIELDKPVRTVPLTSEIATAIPSLDGTFVIAATASELFSLDANTGERGWVLALPGIDALKLSTDGATLFASSQGGLVSIDARNGSRIATACGWNFGLHDDKVSAQVFSVPNLCAGLE